MRMLGVCDNELELIKTFENISPIDLLDKGDFYLCNGTMYMFTGNGVDVILEGGKTIDKPMEETIKTINYNYRMKKQKLLYFYVLKESKKVEAVKYSISDIKELDKLIESCIYQK